LILSTLILASVGLKDFCLQIDEYRTIDVTFNERLKNAPVRNRGMITLKLNYI